MLATDVESGVDQDLDPHTAELAEADALGMPDQPGCFMIGRVDPRVEGPDPEGDGDLLALGPKGGTWRRWLHSCNLISDKLPLPFCGTRP
jgi:hypothetical protein